MVVREVCGPGKVRGVLRAGQGGALWAEYLLTKHWREGRDLKLVGCATEGV